MLNFKPNIDLTKILLPIAIPTQSPVSYVQAAQRQFAEHSRHYRGYAYNPNMRELPLPNLSAYPRLLATIQAKKGLFLSEKAEITFIPLLLPYTKLGTVDDRFAFAEWSELMCNPCSTFEVLE